jgi:hypothetical protein
MPEVRSLAEEIDRCVAAYRQALPAGERVPEDVMRVAEQCARELFSDEPIAPVGGIYGADLPWEAVAPGENPVADFCRLSLAECLLIDVVLRAAGSSDAEHLLDPHPIAVATSRWVVTAVPSVVIDQGQPSDVMAWELFVAPRARDIVFLDGD